MNKTQQWIARNLFGLDTKALSRYATNVLVTNDGPVTWIGADQHQFVEEGYINDIIYSILSTAADKERMAPWDVYKIKDESSLKQYKAEMAKASAPAQKGVDGFSAKRALDFKTKALELYTGDEKLNQILDWPNEKQSFSDLVSDSGVYKRLTGNRYLYATMLDAGANAGKIHELDIMPSQVVTIVASRTFPSKVIKYYLNVDKPQEIAKELVMHDRLFNPLYSVPGDELAGFSPISAMKRNLTRNKSAKTASVKSFDNLGPDTIIYVDDERISGDQGIEQAGALKKKLYEEYSGAGNRKKMAISGYKVGAVNLGLSPVDLAILEAEKWDAVMFANAFNFPYVMLLPDHATLDNVKMAEKALTSRCCLPYLTSFRDNFNRKLRTDWGYKNSNLYVDFDLSVYSELQTDMNSLTDWLMKSWHLTIRQRYQLQQLDIPKEIEAMKELDMVFVPSGFTELSTLNPANMEREMELVDEQLREPIKEEEN